MRAASRSVYASRFWLLFDGCVWFRGWFLGSMTTCPPTAVTVQSALHDMYLFCIAPLRLCFWALL